MGRMFPLDDDPMMHPALPFSLLVAGMAATIAIITALCGFRKKPSPPKFDTSPSHNAATAAADAILAPPPPQVTTSTTLETEEKTEKREDSEEVIKELPPPPAMSTLRETYSCKNLMKKSMSSRKLSSTLSVKDSRSISVNKIREKGKSKADQDSVWTKTIILGEKCKVSEDHDDAVIYDGKGNRVTAYHPRTQSTLSMSRTCSFRDPDTIPNQDEENGITRKEEKDSRC